MCFGVFLSFQFARKIYCHHFFFVYYADLFYSGLGFFFRPCAVLLHVGLSGLWALKIYVGLIYFDKKRLCSESGCIYIFFVI